MYKFTKVVFHSPAEWCFLVGSCSLAGLWLVVQCSPLVLVCLKQLHRSGQPFSSWFPPAGWAVPSVLSPFGTTDANHSGSASGSVFDRSPLLADSVFRERRDTSYQIKTSKLAQSRVRVLWGFWAQLSITQRVCVCIPVFQPQFLLCPLSFFLFSPHPHQRSPHPPCPQLPPPITECCCFTQPHPFL